MAIDVVYELTSLSNIIDVFETTRKMDNTLIDYV